MKLTYNSLTLTDCFELQISRQVRRDPTGKRQGYTERWNVRGWLTGADAAALTTAINSLKTAYGSDGHDLSLTTNASVATSHKLTDADSVDGVKITGGPSFPDGTGPEYANVRHFEIVAEADFDDVGLANLVSFQESVMREGTGGERWLTQTPLDGPVISQSVARYTPVVIVQAGSAVGLNSYPTPPAPLLPSSEHTDRRRIARKGPDRLADGSYRNFEISWQYEFETGAGSDPTPSNWGM